MTKRSGGISSSTPSLPLLSSSWQSQDNNLPGSARSLQTKSVSLDTGLWPDEEDEEAERLGDEDLDKQWDGALLNSMTCCCSCEPRCACCIQDGCSKTATFGKFPYSLGELEGMMRCLKQFRSVLTDIEEQVSEEQASVYNALTVTDREELQEIAELRRAVKQEAGELELQLNELAHHYDDSLKMKIHRLLDEQSLLRSQLRLLPSKADPSSHHISSTKSVATQCCLLPWLPLSEPTRSPLPGSEGGCQRLSSSPTKSDKTDFMGFLQRVRNCV
ncbi:uncharacterized protein itprid1 [Lampris incognitus]|uniref:uncharacterized protein itprid1 n=1 Tax=Lampris incognitus TaxID=2546036 RepID=UPI0024B59DD6|nr:uncharacterized protein itprid1 [Lampris incognitus]